MTPSVQIATKFAKWGKAPLKWTPPKSIESKNLGWIRPDGKISFQTEQAASEYAKNRIVSALKAEKPFERGIFKDKNLILEEIDGVENSIELSKSITLSKRVADFSTEINPSETLEFIHGHPDIWGKGHATPLSFGDGNSFSSDYAVMLGNKLKKMTALNSRGEYNSITWLGNMPLMNAYLKHSSDTWDYLSKLLGRDGYKQCQDFLKRLAQYIKQNGEASKELIQESHTLNIKILEKAHEFTTKEKGTKIIHKLWERNAPNYGVKYETNFSNLV